MKRSNPVMIVWDEADQDVTEDADTDYPDGMGMFARFQRRGREYDFGDIIGVARISRVSPNIRAEAGVHCILNQADAYAIRAAMDTLVLPAGSEQLLPALAPGTGIVRLAHRSSWTHPMHVKFDNEIVDRHLAIPSSSPLSYIESRDLYEIPGMEDALAKLIHEYGDQKARQKNQDPDRASRRAWPFLNAKRVSGWAPDKIVWQMTGEKVPHFVTQKSIIKELVDKKLLEVQEVRLGRTNIAVSRLTEKACKLLHYDPPDSAGVGGPAHQFICHWIVMDASNQGFEAMCEWRGTGVNYAADCGCQRPDERWNAYEVIVGCKSNLVSHLEHLVLCPEVADVVVVCIQKSVVAQLQKELANEPVVAQLGDRLKWELAETYMRRLWP